MPNFLHEVSGQCMQLLYLYGTDPLDDDLAIWSGQDNLLRSGFLYSPLGYIDHDVGSDRR